MANKSLHIVCLDAPAPPDYGGAIDMFYKVQALHAAGFNIHLHYFQYRPGRSASGLEPYCTTIHAYPRRSFAATAFSGQPFIMASRVQQELIDRLKADAHPVLLEGIHCAGIIPFLQSARKMVVRMHNDEAAYYKKLAEAERNPFKKSYFKREARLLQKAQHALPANLPLACVAHHDMTILQQKYGLTNLHFIPSFTPWQTISIAPGKGDYCLYHGNMQVAENKAAAMWLLSIFEGTHIPLYIAGKGAATMKGMQNQFVKVIPDPTAGEMEDLVRNAQVHVLPSMNKTGLKLKMLHALFCGRHCITNDAGAAGTEFGGMLHIANDAHAFREKVQELFALPFSATDLEKRAQLLDHYNNTTNALKLKALLD